MANLRADAVKFFSMLAAGAPFSNVAWGKSKREITEYYALAAQSLEAGLSLCKQANKNANGTCAGYQHLRDDDEPAEMCKKCPQNEFYEI